MLSSVKKRLNQRKKIKRQKTNEYDKLLKRDKL